MIYTTLDVLFHARKLYDAYKGTKAQRWQHYVPAQLTYHGSGTRDRQMKMYHVLPFSTLKTNRVFSTNKFKLFNSKRPVNPTEACSKGCGKGIEATSTVGREAMLYHSRNPVVCRLIFNLFIKLNLISYKIQLLLLTKIILQWCVTVGPIKPLSPCASFEKKC